MKKKSVVATSLLSMGVCASLIAGSTFALFTSESQVNVSVTSATVNVTATASNLNVYSGEWNGEEYASVEQTREYVNEETGAKGYYFANGGFASISGASNKIDVEAISPYDKVTFDLTVENHSTIDVQYRTVVGIESDNGLLDVLEVKVGGLSTVKDGNGNMVTAYSKLTEAVTYTVEISLPDLGNEYQGKTANLFYRVEAVQGNAVVKNVVRVKSLQEYFTDYNFTCNSATTAATVLEPKANDELIIETWQDVWFGGDLTVRNITFEQGISLSNDNANGNQLGRWKARGYGIAMGAAAGRLYAEEVTIDGCTFDGIRGNAIQASNINYTLTVKNTTVNSWGNNHQTAIDKTKSDSAIRGDLIAGGSLVLQNITFGLDQAVDLSADYGPLQVNVNNFEGNTTNAQPAGTYFKD